MIRTRWYKVLLDLWSNRGRTMVVAMAIAVGVYSVGVAPAQAVEVAPRSAAAGPESRGPAPGPPNDIT